VPEIADLNCYGGSSVPRRLRSRAEVARKINRYVRPDPIDRLLITPRGQEIMGRFFAADDDGGPDPVDVVVAWAAILDELVQKAAATGRRVRLAAAQERAPRFRARRAQRKHLQSSPVQGRQVVRLDGAPSSSARFSTVYIDELGFSEWDDNRIDSDILALDVARIEIEAALGFSAPETWTIPDSIPTSHFSEAGGYTFGFRLLQEINQRLEKICAREHDGQVFLELRYNEPDKIPYVLHRAIN
jgi:hypothetical protein